jgi:hypothetical protein
MEDDPPWIAPHPRKKARTEGEFPVDKVEEMLNMGEFGRIPFEIQVLILSQLNWCEFKKLSETSRAFRAIFYDDEYDKYLWKKIYEKKYGKAKLIDYFDYRKNLEAQEGASLAITTFFSEDGMRNVEVEKELDEKAFLVKKQFSGNVSYLVSAGPAAFAVYTPNETCGPKTFTVCISYRSGLPSPSHIGEALIGFKRPFKSVRPGNARFPWGPNVPAALLRPIVLLWIVNADGECRGVCDGYYKQHTVVVKSSEKVKLAAFQHILLESGRLAKIDQVSVSSDASTWEATLALASIGPCEYRGDGMFVTEDGFLIDSRRDVVDRLFEEDLPWTDDDGRIQVTRSGDVIGFDYDNDKRVVVQNRHPDLIRHDPSRRIRATGTALLPKFVDGTHRGGEREWVHFAIDTGGKLYTWTREGPVVLHGIDYDRVYIAGVAPPAHSDRGIGISFPTGHSEYICLLSVRREAPMLIDAHAHEE